MARAPGRYGVEPIGGRYGVEPIVVRYGAGRVCREADTGWSRYCRRPIRGVCRVQYGRVAAE